MKEKLYLFLDVDGVLNNDAAFKLQNIVTVLSNENLVVYQWFMDKLKTKYDVEVILSSTWRMYKDCINKLNKYSKKYSALKFVRKTPDSHIMREEEILNYVNAFEIPKNQIIILDDEPITNELKDRHLQTFHMDGLTFEKAIQFLEKLGI